VTFCFTPEHRGIAPHHTSPPLVKEEFAEFCAAMIHRYAGDSPIPLASRDAVLAPSQSAGALEREIASDR
jgi:beta-xylosidase